VNFGSGDPLGRQILTGVKPVLSSYGLKHCYYTRKTHSLQEHYNSRPVHAYECGDSVGSWLSIVNGRPHGTDGDADKDGSGDGFTRRRNSLTRDNVTNGPDVTSTRRKDVGRIHYSGAPGIVPTDTDDGPAT